MVQGDYGTQSSEGYMFLFKKGKDSVCFFDVVSAWLVVGAKHDRPELVCMEASLDVCDADHSQATDDSVQQAEANYYKVVCIPGDGTAKVEDVYEMGLSECGTSEKKTLHIHRVRVFVSEMA